MSRLSHIRNFSIVAHIDHGKSTLADRLMQMTDTVKARDMKEQLLDSMDIERERGITIKANTVRIKYHGKDGNDYILNLIDTPGHVDFAYEVSRSMHAVEGSLLVVDASQGVEAQTLANVYQALEANHEIIPVLNKIDLPAADCEAVRKQIEDVIGIDTTDALLVSAKSGDGVPELLEEIVNGLPPPQGNLQEPLKAMLVDSWYDAFLGVIVLVRVLDGELRRGDRIRMMSTGAVYAVDRVGFFCPDMQETGKLAAGEIGFLTASIKRVSDTRVGDTVTHERGGCTVPVAGLEPSRPVVFCGLFPSDNSEFENLRDAIEKVALNDASFSSEPESSTALGFGFRCGFLGLLHMEVVRERLEREYGLDLITTAPSVVYRVHRRDGEIVEIYNPADLPEGELVEAIEEPRIDATILCPEEYLGGILKLCHDRRGTQKELSITGSRAMTVYNLPLNEVVFDFYDRLKSVSRGYASFDYVITGYQTDQLVKLQILVNGEPVDALSLMVHRSNAEKRGRAMCEKLKELIPRHLFKIPIQAAIGGRVVARETIAALRKDVTAKCYGGDVTRKRKLLERQKEGKRKMRQFGRVEIPQRAFVSALRVDSR
ncbi:MAG: translation elongation factor 4 [Rhodobacteraceae bacterium]|nr:translation elongation factor 4 [Paracoccaceae bacterium]MCY4196873.1 translation elongation factor 4 [Paracoccaceae bacterium]